MFELSWRLLVTTAGIALPTLLALLPLPGLEAGDPFGPASLGADLTPQLSVGALGLDAVLLAFVLVELAALVAPRWRALRHGAGRVTLMRWTLVVGAFLVMAQALFLAWSLRTFGWTVFHPGLGPLLVDTLALVAGTLALLAAARLVTRWGNGHGLSVVVVLGALPAWLERARLGQDGADSETLARTLVFATIGTVVLVGRELRGERLPVAGLVPLLLPGWALQLALFAAVFLPLGGHGFDFVLAPSEAALMGVAVALTAGLAWLWQRQRGLRALRERGSVIVLSAGMLVLILIGDRALGWEVSFGAAAGGLAFFVLAVACALDVMREAALRARVKLVPILAFSDIAVVDRVGRSLAAADIPHVMRGVGHRTLLRFFGPWVPVKLLVDRERAEEAGRLARAEANREAYEEIARIF